MNAIQDARVLPMNGHGRSSKQEPFSESTSHHRLAAPLRNAILLTRQWLLSEQVEEGFWEGELEGDAILESEAILLSAYLGQEHSEFAQQAAEYLVEQQLPDGGWALYPGGDVDISGSVKAYFALKLVGHESSSEYMQRARTAIWARGGADRVNSFTRFYLALLGQISYDHCPSVPVEWVLLPQWFPVSLNRVSAWSRTIIVPLSIISALRPVKKVSAQQGICELFRSRPEEWPPLSCPGQQTSGKRIGWDRFFRVVDRSLKFLQDHHLMPLRKRAIAQAERWMVERFEGSDGLGAIFPPIIWSTIALDSLGYTKDSPEMQYCDRQLQDLVIRSDDTARLQPCKSPVWDTAITVRALIDSGVPRHQPEIRRAIDWLLKKEVRRRGDWSATVQAEPGGWFFEHNNEFYPDLDDTAMVLMALRDQADHVERSGEVLPPKLQLIREDFGDPAIGDPANGDTVVDDTDDARRDALRVDRIAAASQRAMAWMFGMQNKDGGWGAFDRNNDQELLCHVPFADHNAMIDPSSPDVTARVLEAMGTWRHRVGDPVADRAIEYLRRTQEADGSWPGRWGVNYIYGTWQGLVGLSTVGISATDPMMVRAANWLLAHQQPSGAWGESPASYAEPNLRGQGPATASQTAWALLGLMAADRWNHPAVANGIRHLLDTQQEDGTWDEPHFTGTGFPQVFYLRYHLYPVYFPLMALSRWAVQIGNLFEEADTACLRLADSAALAMRDI